MGGAMMSSVDPPLPPGQGSLKEPERDAVTGAGEDKAQMEDR